MAARPRLSAAAAGRAELLAEVRARLADDLDTVGAIAAVDGWADATLEPERHDRTASRRRRMVPRPSTRCSGSPC